MSHLEKLNFRAKVFALKVGATLSNFQRKESPIGDRGNFLSRTDAQTKVTKEQSCSTTNQTFGIGLLEYKTDWSV